MRPHYMTWEDATLAGASMLDRDDPSAPENWDDPDQNPETAED